MHKILLLSFFTIVLPFLSPSTGSFAPAPHDTYLISVDQVVDGLVEPVGIAHAGDDRLFVVERRGVIRVVQNDVLVEEPFLDIQEVVNVEGLEQGLLGLVFHPDYQENGYFYVYYSGHDDDTRLSRFQVRADDPNRANPASELQLMLVEQPEETHNAGDLVFGQDGYLYMALGDGGSAQSWGNAQTLETLLGAILRIDVDGGLGLPADCDASGHGRYQIPDDNPFLDGPGGACDEIWLMGLRNPWRFSFDSQTNDLYIADVGVSTFEEINFLPAGAQAGLNYGWPCYEGYHSLFSNYCSRTDKLVFPVGGYPHSGRSCHAIIGGHVYRGSRYPQMQGHYFLGDFCEGKLSRMVPNGDGWHQRLVAQLPVFISSIDTGSDGELYVAAYDAEGNGGIYRLRPVATPHRIHLPIMMVK